MQFKDFFTELYLSEGVNDALALRKLEKAGKQKFFDQLSRLDQTPTKKHLPKLVDYFLDGAQIEILGSYYRRFVNSNLVNLDINKFKTFAEFEAAVDNQPTKRHFTGTISLPPVYDDPNVTIWKANNKEEAIECSQGYTFCIGAPEVSANMYFSYRYSRGSTFYFCKFKNKSAAKNGAHFEDPDHFIVIDAGQTWESETAQFQITHADNGLQGGGTEDTTPEKISEKFPELIPAFEQNIFQPNPLSQEEQRAYGKIKNMPEEEFYELKYEDKIMYINLGKPIIRADIWAGKTNNPDMYMDNRLRRLYINVGANDLTPHQKLFLRQRNQQGLLNRYEEMLAQRSTMKLEQEYSDLTDDEKVWIQNHPNDIKLPQGSEQQGNVLRRIVQSGDMRTVFQSLTPKRKALYVALQFKYGVVTAQNGTGFGKLSTIILNDPYLVDIVDKCIKYKIKTGNSHTGYSDFELGHIEKHIDGFLPLIRQYGATTIVIGMISMAGKYNHALQEILKLIDEKFGAELTRKSIVEFCSANYITLLGVFTHEWKSEHNNEVIQILDHIQIKNSISELNDTSKWKTTEQLAELNRFDKIKEWGLLPVYKRFGQSYPESSRHNIPNLSEKATVAYFLNQLKYLESQIWEATKHEDKIAYSVKSSNHVAGPRGIDLAMEYLINFLTKMNAADVSESTFIRLFWSKVVHCLQGIGKLISQEQHFYSSIFGDRLVNNHQYTYGLKILLHYMDVGEIPYGLEEMFFKQYYLHGYKEKIPDLLATISEDEKFHNIVGDMIFGKTSQANILMNMKPNDPILKTIPDEILQYWLATKNQHGTTEYGRPILGQGYGVIINPFYYEAKSRGLLTPEQAELEANAWIGSNFKYANWKPWESLINPDLLTGVIPAAPDKEEPVKKNISPLKHKKRTDPLDKALDKFEPLDEPEEPDEPTDV